MLAIDFIVLKVACARGTGLAVRSASRQRLSDSVVEWIAKLISTRHLRQRYAVSSADCGVLASTSTVEQLSLLLVLVPVIAILRVPSGYV